MSEKILKGRLVQKHDTAENWSKATSFVPKQGEVIIYDKDTTHPYERVKVGDGSTLVSSLPFIDDNKVDKVTGKGLSTNDYTTTEKNKLAGIADGANKTVIDSAMSSTSTNPVQNKVVTAIIDDLSEMVGDKSVATQISEALASIGDQSSIIYQDAEDHINIDRISEDYMNSNLKITGDDIIFTDYAMDSYPIIDWLKDKTDKGHKHSAADITSGTLPISRGGTGATTAADARANLGIPDHGWTKIYDSGEITSAVNAFANINISGYKKLMVAVKCVNDGTSRASKQGSITFTSLTGIQYQFPVWTAMFTNTEETTGNMGWFEITDGWLICSNASRNLETNSFLSNTEGGTADNLAGIGGGIMKCSKTLSKIMVSALDQDENCYFNAGSRLIVWGGNI